LFHRGEMAAGVVLAPQADVGVVRSGPLTHRLGEVVREQRDAGGTRTVGQAAIVRAIAQYSRAEDAAESVNQ
jgi:hypothetical protein